jgi:hypothetical protein
MVVGVTAAGLTVLKRPGNTSRKASDRKNSILITMWRNSARLVLWRTEDFQGQFAKKSRGHSAHERSNMGSPIDYRTLVGHRDIKQRIEAAVDPPGFTRWLAQVAVSARPKRNAYGPLAPAKLRVFAAGVEQRFRKHPLELISDHDCPWSIWDSFVLQATHPRGVSMDHHKNPQQNQILKSTYL